ncbi:hypothetical protein BDZ85DRAFT_286132 [Elsinoe ampelina]|uniref:Uncharacterized protein n=1 Tax=Elsinoe ampelina TaxID=302913 RepID=A0A6A6FYT0_9PEZI|nr:hypothetical protein BDZ85DRAFT_286132 [Elsinoe ampelina]
MRQRVLNYDSCFDACQLNFDEAFPEPACGLQLSLRLDQGAREKRDLLQASTSTLKKKTPTKSTIVPKAASTKAKGTVMSSSWTTACITRSVCVDGINSCYMRWGGCFDANSCDGVDRSPTPLPCPTLTTVLIGRNAIAAVPARPTE